MNLNDISIIYIDINYADKYGYFKVRIQYLRIIYPVRFLQKRII